MKFEENQIKLNDGNTIYKGNFYFIYAETDVKTLFEQFLLAESKIKLAAEHEFFVEIRIAITLFGYYVEAGRDKKEGEKINEEYFVEKLETLRKDVKEDIKTADHYRDKPKGWFIRYVINKEKELREHNATEFEEFENKVRTIFDKIKIPNSIEDLYGGESNYSYLKYLVNSIYSVASAVIHYTADPDMEDMYSLIECVFELTKLLFKPQAKKELPLNYDKSRCPFDDCFAIDDYTCKKLGLQNCLKGNLFVGIEYINDNPILTWYVIKQSNSESIGTRREKSNFWRLNQNLTLSPYIMQYISSKPGYSIYKLHSQPKPLNNTTMKELNKDDKNDICVKLVECVSVLHKMENPIPLRGMNNNSFVICERDSKYIPVLIDLAESKDFTDEGNGMSIEFTESTRYLAPELLYNKNISAENLLKTDIYSLGILFCKIQTSSYNTSSKYLGTMSEMVNRMVSVEPLERPDISEVESIIKDIVNCGEVLEGNIKQDASDEELLKEIIEKDVVNDIDRECSYAIHKAWSDISIEKEIGSGSYGHVFKCSIDKDKGIKDEVAIKVIPIPNQINKQELEAYKNPDEYLEEELNKALGEVKSLIYLKSSHIVHINRYDHVKKRTGNGHYILILMDLKEDISSCFPNYKMDEESVAVDRVIRVCEDICDALKVCEANKIIHRDIKPQNIFVGKYKDYYLGDFGFSKEMNAQISTYSSKGTLLYAAPEVISFDDEYDNRADIFSLGLVLYELLNCKLEENDRIEAIKQVRRNISRGEALTKPEYGSDDLFSIIRKMCAKDPKERYSSAEEVLEAIENLKVIQASNDKEKQNLDYTKNAHLSEGKDIEDKAGVHEKMLKKGISLLKKESITDKECGFRLISDIADKGHARALGLLGFCYMNGVGVKEDIQEGFSLYKKAAEVGDVDAMRDLARCYEIGRGTDRDYFEAFSWYSKAAEAGDADAMLKLGMFYGFGHGTGKDSAREAYWLNKGTKARGVNDIERERERKLMLRKNNVRGTDQDEKKVLNQTGEDDVLEDRLAMWEALMGGAMLAAGAMSLKDTRYNLTDPTDKTD